MAPTEQLPLNVARIAQGELPKWGFGQKAINGAKNIELPNIEWAVDEIFGGKFLLAIALLYLSFIQYGISNQR